jgi:PAS domain S-box-containing protein
MRAGISESVPIRYGMAAGVTVAALLVRLPFASLLTNRVAFITFFPAVAAAGLFGGRGPGMVATILSAWITAVWILPPSGSIVVADSVDAVSLGMFVALGTLISYLCGQLRETRLSELAQRRLFEETLASIDDAVISTDAEGRIRLSNHVAERLTGWSQAESAGRPLAEIVRMTGHPNEVSLHARDGRRIPVEQRESPILDGLSRVTGKVHVFRDLTARLKSEEELERSSHRLRLALEAGQVGVWDWDISQNNITWSELVYRIHGLEPGQFGGKVEDFAALIYEDDREPVQRAIEAALAGEIPYEVEFRVRHPSGEMHWVETTATVLRDAEGRPVRMIGATTDLTERKRAEIELRRSEERFRAVFADAPIGMVLTHLDGQLIQVNRAYCEIVGYSPEELKSLSILSLTHPDEAEANERLFRQLVSGELSSYVLEKRVRRKDGEVIWVRASATALVTSHRMVPEVIRLVEEITERKQAEAERNQLIDALQRSNEDFAGFAHAVSHDLRSPLRTVTSMVQILDDTAGGRLGPESAEVMRFITSAAARMETLIADLLAFSQVDQESKSQGPVDLNECLRDALTNLGESIRESGAKISSNPLPIVAGHRGPLVQLLQNLIGNSLKYRGAAPPRIDISVESIDREWRLHVADNGIGFEPQYAEQIFAPFKRLHGEEYPGNGIGLASCQRIVRRYGGSIRADSAPGQGSVFTVMLPKTLTGPFILSSRGANAGE